MPWVDARFPSARPNFLLQLFEHSTLTALKHQKPIEGGTIHARYCRQSRTGSKAFCTTASTHRDRILSQGAICNGNNTPFTQTGPWKTSNDIHTVDTTLYHSKAESMVAGTNCHSTFLSQKIDDFPRLVRPIYYLQKNCPSLSKPILSNTFLAQILC